MNIRLEQPKDYREVENLTREAFWNVYRPGYLKDIVISEYGKDGTDAVLVMIKRR